MRPAVSIAVATAFLASLALPAGAQSLGQKMIQRDSRERLAESASDLPQLCGAEITTDIDFTNFADADYETNNSIPGYCEGPVSAIRQLCNDPLGKEAVSAQISRLVCSIGTERAAQLSEDGTYSYSFTWEDSSGYDWHIEFLKNNL